MLKDIAYNSCNSQDKPEKSSYLPALCLQSAVFFERKFLIKKLNGKYDKTLPDKIINNDTMKKLFVILFIIIVVAVFYTIKAQKDAHQYQLDVIKTKELEKNITVIAKINLEKDYSPQASIILAKYLMDEYPLLYAQEPIMDDTNAVFYDLNDDGVEEIIGICHSDGGSAGYTLHILKKNFGSGYKDISPFINFYAGSPIFVHKSKTNGFHDIEFTARTNKPDQNFVEANGFMHIGRWIAKFK